MDLSRGRQMPRGKRLPLWEYTYARSRIPGIAWYPAWPGDDPEAATEVKRKSVQHCWMISQTSRLFGFAIISPAPIDICRVSRFHSGILSELARSASAF